MSTMAGEKEQQTQVVFEDFLPVIAEQVGADGLIAELCKGFELLMDPGRGAITLESLKRRAAELGVEGLRDDDLAEMVREGDVDGDGVLTQMDFCVLMVRLSPTLMEMAARGTTTATTAATTTLMEAEGGVSGRT